MLFTCTVTGFIKDSYGKYGKDDVDDYIVMEYNQFFPWCKDYMIAELRFNSDFIEYISQPNILDNYAQMFMMTLPGDRLSFYRTSNVAKMRSDIFSYTNEIAAALGDYPV